MTKGQKTKLLMATITGRNISTATNTGQLTNQRCGRKGELYWMLGHRSHSDVVSARVMIGRGSLGVDEVVFVCLIVFFFGEQ